MCVSVCVCAIVSSRNRDEKAHARTRSLPFVSCSLHTMVSHSSRCSLFTEIHTVCVRLRLSPLCVRRCYLWRFETTDDRKRFTHTHSRMYRSSIDMHTLTCTHVTHTNHKEDDDGNETTYISYSEKFHTQNIRNWKNYRSSAALEFIYLSLQK